MHRIGVKVIIWSLFEWSTEFLMVCFLRLLAESEEMEISGIGNAHGTLTRDEAPCRGFL